MCKQDNAYIVISSNQKIIAHKRIARMGHTKIDLDELLKVKRTFDQRERARFVRNVVKQARGFTEEISDLPLKEQFVFFTKGIALPLIKQVANKLKTNHAPSPLCQDSCRLL